MPNNLKILLTGSTGFIGSAFMRQAIERGHEIAGLIHPEKAIPLEFACDDRVTYLRSTLDEAPWQRIESFRPDVCVHAAWITTPGVYMESPENFKLLENSLKFLRRVRECGTNHIVALGTCVEYQITHERLSEERTPVAPVSPYARCKNDLRLGLEEETKAHGGLFCWARVFYPYGPGEQSARLCSSIIQNISRGEKLTLKTPNSTKDYIYIDDLADALLAVTEKKFNGIINIGTGTGTTVREIAQTLGGMLGKPELIGEVNPPEVDPLGYVVADVSRLLVLGWKPAHTMKQGLEKLVASLR